MQILIAALLLAAQPDPAPAPDTPPAPPPARTAQTTSIKLARDDNDRMTIPIRVGGAGPFDFMVDTGAERTVISRELADRLGLVPGSPVRLQSVLGSGVVPTVRIPSLDTDAQRITVEDSPALAAADIGADGIVGVDGLEQQRVTFDFRARRMDVEPSRSRPARLDGTTIVVEARRRAGRLLFTRATVDGVAVSVVVDTGSAVSIGNVALRDRLVRRRAALRQVELITVLGERASVPVARLENLKIGAVTLQQMTIAFSDAPIFGRLRIADRPAMLLGMNAMRAFDRVSVDFGTGKVRFVLPGTSKAPPVASFEEG